KSMAGQGAGAAEGAGASVLDNRKSVCRGCHIVWIEIDQMLGPLHAVRIVTGHAGGFLIDNMVTMAPVLSQGISGLETLIAEQPVAVVALVAKRVTAQVLRRTVTQNELPLEDRRIE